LAARLRIVGGHAPESLRALGGNGLELVGEAAELDEHLAQAALAPVPLRAGSGTRFKILEAFAAGLPVISVDTKKRELVGNFKAVGREYEPTGRPVQVRGHDFKDTDLGHAIPLRRV